MGKVGTDAVHLGDESKTWKLVRVALARDGFGFGLNARHGPQRRNRALDHADRALRLDGERDVARGVDDVDGVLIPRTVSGGAGDGNTALLFLLHPVHLGSTFVHFADLVGDTRVI